MKKTVAFKSPARPIEPADSWVASRSAEVEAPIVDEAPAEHMKRLTIDIPESLHTRVKMTCASRGVKMVDVLRKLLEREFAS